MGQMAGYIVVFWPSQVDDVLRALAAIAAPASRARLLSAIPWAPSRSWQVHAEGRVYTRCRGFVGEPESAGGYIDEDVQLRVPITDALRTAAAAARWDGLDREDGDEATCDLPLAMKLLMGERWALLKLTSLYSPRSRSMCRASPLRDLVRGAFEHRCTLLAVDPEDDLLHPLDGSAPYRYDEARFKLDEDDAFDLDGWVEGILMDPERGGESCFA